MNRQFLSLIFWSLAAVASIVLFSFLKLKFRSDGFSNEPMIEIESDKIDVSVLPDGAGENTLAGKSFSLFEDEHSLSWNFIDERKLRMDESFVIDGFFPMNVSWLAEYALDAPNGILHVKRIAMVDGAEELTGSRIISERLTRMWIDKINECVGDIFIEEKHDWKSLVHERVSSYVDRLLFELKSMSVVQEGDGILFENPVGGGGLSSPSLVFKKDGFDGTVTLSDESVFIRMPVDDDWKTFGGTVSHKGERLESMLYEFVRDRSAGTVNLIPVGKASFSVTVGEKISDSQSVECILKSLSIPDETFVPKDGEFKASKILTQRLYWMNASDEISERE